MSISKDKLNVKQMLVHITECDIIFQTLKKSSSRITFGVLFYMPFTLVHIKIFLAFDNIERTYLTLFAIPESDIILQTLK